MPRSKAKTIKIRLLDGDQDGIQTAAIQSTIYEAIAFPRSRFGDLKSAKVNINRPGAYVLVGDTVEIGKRRSAYIGESSRSVYSRISNHNNPNSREYKSFWKSAIVLTSKDSKELYFKPKYIERELKRIGERDGNWEIINKNDSTFNISELSDSDEDFILDFIEASTVMVRSLGYDLFLDPPNTLFQDSSSIDTRESIKQKVMTKFTCHGKGGVYAEMLVDPGGGFIVKKNSIAKGTMTDGIRPDKKSDREKLIRLKILKKYDDNYIFTKDHEFSSVSDAASQIKGSLRNGNLEWKLDGTKTTYGEWKRVMSRKTKK